MDMKEKIRQHFNKIFSEAPKTRKSIDLKQEMLQNALDKYDDMMAEGYSDQDAYQNVISSIGDVSELFVDLEEKNLLMLPEKDRRRCALLKAVSAGMYTFAGVVFLFFGMLNNIVGNYFYSGNIDFTSLGFCIGALICIPPTVILVYASNMYPGFTKKERQSMVEDYKQMKYMGNKNKAVRKSINTIIWTVAVIVYMVISFNTNAWHITWIIFLIAVCVQSVVALIFSLNMED